MKKLYPNQKGFDNIAELKNAINKTNSVKVLNRMRAAVVGAKNNEILQLWQDKYRSLRQY